MNKTVKTENIQSKNMKMNIGISDSNRQGVVQILSVVLSDEVLLYKNEKLSLECRRSAI
jgi:hypothetical protein